LLFDGHTELYRVHMVCDELERRIRRELGTFDIMIHPEPFGMHQPETKESMYKESQALKVD